MTKYLIFICLITINLFVHAQTPPQTRQRMDAFEDRINELEQKVTILEQDQFHNKPLAILDRFALHFNPKKCKANIFNYVLTDEKMRDEDGQLVVKVISELKSCENYKRKNYYVVLILALKKAVIVEDKELLLL